MTLTDKSSEVAENTSDHSDTTHEPVANPEPAHVIMRVTKRSRKRKDVALKTALRRC